MSEVIQFPRPSERRSAEGARCLTSAGRPERDKSANPINADTRSAIYEALIWRAFK